MDEALARLEPRALWEHFAALCRIPRPSKHEERVVAWIRSWSEEQGFEVRSDAAGNLLVAVPATSGHEGAPTVVLQSHLDMVCEKHRNQEHDFMRDPIRPHVEGDWVRASGTTLGADNGIGVAAALAVATDRQAPHGPLELLFTLDEETGLTGAARLDGAMLAGRTLLNLDSEDDGVLFVGCAGGADSLLTLEPSRVTAAGDGSVFRLVLGGLLGGHSGMNIHESRGNALKLLGRLLQSAIDWGLELDLGPLRGGSMHNAIPREAEATVVLGGDGEARLRELLARSLDRLRTEIHPEERLSVELVAAEPCPRVLSRGDRDRLLQLLLALPHGVLAIDREIPALVETSSSLAAVRPAEGGGIEVVTSSRSSNPSAMDGTLGAIRAVAGLAGARVETHDAYPGWKPNLDSPVLGVARRVFAELWGREPEVTAVHAGLECGLIAERVPGLDMISFGPQIDGAHSPDERVQISSVARFWDALRRVLAELAR